MGRRYVGDVPSVCPVCMDILLDEGFVKRGFRVPASDNGYGLPHHLTNPRKTPLKEEDDVFCENCEELIEDGVIWFNDFSVPVCHDCRVEVYGEGFEEEEIQLLDADLQEAQDVYERFHGRSSEKLDKLRIPRPSVLAYIGQPSCVGYSSDKFSPGKEQNYVHTWESEKSREGGIIGYDPESRCLFSIVPARITSRGVEDAIDEDNEDKR